MVLKKSLAFAQNWWNMRKEVATVLGNRQLVVQEYNPRDSCLPLLFSSDSISVFLRLFST